METSLKKVCPVCNGMRWNKSLRFKNLLVCDTCKIHFDPASDTLPFDYYEAQSSYSGKVSSREKMEERQRNIKQRFSLMKSYLKKGMKILDVGCNDGMFLSCLIRKGLEEVTGIEASEKSVAYLKSSGLRILQGTVENVRLPKEHFDCITLFHVLEHLQNPKEGLTCIKNALKNNGIAVVEVPNIESPSALLHGESWEMIYPEHRYHFTEPTLMRLFESAGFNIIEMKTRDFDQYRTAIGKNLRKLGINIGKPKQKKADADKDTHTSKLASDESSIPMLKHIRRAVQLPIKALLGFLVKTFKRGDYLFIIAKKTLKTLLIL